MRTRRAADAPPRPAGVERAAGVFVAVCAPVMGLLVAGCLLLAPDLVLPGRVPLLAALGVAAPLAAGLALVQLRRTGRAPLWWALWATLAVWGVGACVHDPELRQSVAVGLVVAPLFTALFTRARRVSTGRATALHLVLTAPAVVHLAASSEGDVFERAVRAACAVSVVGVVVVCSAVLRRRLDDALARADHLALHDPLTGLLNRRGLAARLEELPPAPWLGVLLADVDHFKVVNDRLGHDAGDQVLLAVAAAARRAVRGGDLLVRWGGEEVLVVVPLEGPGELEVLAQRLRREVAEAPTAAPVTLSAGGAALPVGPVGPVGPVDPARRGAAAVRADVLERLVPHADRALYAAKAAGRDRVHLQLLDATGAPAGAAAGTATGATTRPRTGGPGGEDRPAPHRPSPEPVPRPAPGAPGA
ncbi:GGDEF domain-containing protein [Kineococcus sp. SYSU DK006]|uniref:GGDEF domain-containing protein n=1 Tax=Kineococcus sp. SYSU DK006 TaxID=3383127 RepID=UPI003D7D8970